MVQRTVQDIKLARALLPLTLLPRLPSPTSPRRSALGDALVYMMQRTAQDLKLVPTGEWDVKSLAEDLPTKHMYSGFEDPNKVLSSAVCSWVRNATVSPHGGCPTNVADMCKLDYASWGAVRESYKAQNIEEVGAMAAGGERGRGFARGHTQLCTHAPLHACGRNQCSSSLGACPLTRAAPLI